MKQKNGNAKIEEPKMKSTYGVCILWSGECGIVLDSIGGQFLNFVPFNAWSFFLQETAEQGGKPFHFVVIEAPLLISFQYVQECFQFEFEVHQCITFGDFMELLGVGCIALVAANLKKVIIKLMISL